MKKTSIAAISLIFAAFTMGAAGIMPAFAQSSAASGKPAIHAGTDAHASASFSAAQAKGDAAISARVDALNSLQTRVNAMTRLSAGQKASLTASIQSALQSMTVLKAKIDADTDMTTLQADIQSITKDNRIYALIIPQGRIEASMDREQTIVALMDSLGAKLQARISADQAAGKNVTVMQSEYADFQAKVADASTQSNAALSLVANLQPDQGNQAVLKSNAAALKQAMADVKTAESDLKTARKDAGNIAGSLKGDQVSAKANVKASGK